MKKKQIQAEGRKRWQICDIDTQRTENLAKELNISPLMAKLVIARNIGNGQSAEIKDFLHPPEALLTETRGLCQPEELKQALARLQRAMALKEKILIHGDSDADGITGTTILVTGLRTLGLEVIYDFPVRPREGHGLQPRIIDEAKTKQVAVIITADCGTKDIISTTYAKTQGIDVIICDHHQVGKKRPPALALINPFTMPAPNLAHGLAGAGVAFKLILALFDHLGHTIQPELMEYLLALTALGTISDRMSMLNPMNRLLVREGVKYLNNTPRQGLNALKQVSVTSLETILTSRDISRTLAPRLNAPGRIGDPEAGIPDANVVVSLLLLGEGKRSAKKAKQLTTQFLYTLELEQSSRNSNTVYEAGLIDDVNERRKFITTKIEDEIEDLIQEQVGEDDRLIVVQGKDWNSGVIGIDTDRLRDRFLKPAMILTEYSGNSYLRGSVRSIPTINMYQIIDRVSDEFEQRFNRQLFQMEVDTPMGKYTINAFGGHSQACGFSLHINDLPVFLELIRAEVSKLPEGSFNYFYDILSPLSFDEITSNLISQLEEQGPYGQNFEFPIFYLQNCQVSKPRPFGNKYQKSRTPHVEFWVGKDKTSKNADTDKRLNAVGFGLWEQYTEVVQNTPGQSYDLIFTLEHRTRRHNGRNMDKIRLNVLDIRCSKY